MKTLIIAPLLLALIALAAPASAVQLFDFDAQAILPGAPGGTASAYGRIVNGQAVAAPLPLDFAHYEYTIVVTGLVLDASGATSQFSGGTVAIFQDDATAADWSAPGTFSDGTAILTGVMPAFQHTMFTATLGSGYGTVDWTGGSMLDSLAPADQVGWPFLTTVSRASSLVQPGYTEQWDGKVEPVTDVVPSADTSWSGVKALFR